MALFATQTSGSGQSRPADALDLRGDVVRTAEHAPRAEPPQEVADVGDEVLATTVLVVLVGIYVWPIAIDLDREHHLGIGEVDLEHVVADPDLVVVHGQRRPLSGSASANTTSAGESLA